MSLPSVSVIVPVRNEAAHIVGCLEAIRAQDYGGDIEVIVIDGLSSDGTRRLAEATGARVLDNPLLTAGAALNLGIAAAAGDVIVRVDGRCRIEPDYVRQCVRCLEATGADCVGGRRYAVGPTYLSFAIALATSCPFGVGGSRFHFSEEAGHVDTVYLGVYWRGVFDRVGPFDEDMVRNQDNVFNYRLRRAGGRVYFEPAIRCRYHVRSSLRGLWRQHWDFAYWNVRAIQKYPQAAVAPRHLVPLLFILGLLGSAALSFVHFLFGWLFLAVAGSYIATSLGFSVAVAAPPQAGWRYLPILPLVFACLHFSYGLGYFGGLYGLLRGFPASRAAAQRGQPPAERAKS